MTAGDAHHLWRRSDDRDFNYVDNAVTPICWRAFPTPWRRGRAFNIGTGKSQTLNEVYAAIAEQLGFTANPKYGPPREGDIRHSLANIERAKRDLGYQPKVQFREGLRKTVEWYLEEKEKSAVVLQA